MQTFRTCPTCTRRHLSECHDRCGCCRGVICECGAPKLPERNGCPRHDAGAGSATIHPFAATGKRRA